MDDNTNGNGNKQVKGNGKELPALPAPKSDKPAEPLEVEVEIVGTPKGPGGRPTKYRDTWPERTNKWVKKQLALQMLPTQAGLSMHFGVTQDTVIRCGKKHPEFSESLKRLMAAQQQMLIQHSFLGKGNPYIGTLLLKANHGFKDKTEVDMNIGVKKQHMIVNGKRIEF